MHVIRCLLSMLNDDPSLSRYMLFVRHYKQSVNIY